MAFALHQLVSRYLKKMSPIVRMVEREKGTNRRLVNKAPLYIWWERFDKNILSKEGEQFDAYREELFGAGYVESTPELYSFMSLIKDWNMEYSEFLELDLHTRAKMLAYNQIKNMMEVRQQHMSTMKRKRESKAKS